MENRMLIFTIHNILGVLASTPVDYLTLKPENWIFGEFFVIILFYISGKQFTQDLSFKSTKPGIKPIILDCKFTPSSLGITTPADFMRVLNY